MNDETLNGTGAVGANGYRPGEWLADEDDDDDAPAARSRIDDDTGAAAGCAFIVAVLTKGEPFKLNNDFRSRYTRLLMQQEPELQGFFETRTLRERGTDDE